MARMSQSSVTAYIKRAEAGGWMRNKPKPQKVIQQKKAPDLEGQFEAQLKLHKIEGYVREHRFCDRRWRFDFAWTSSELMLALEVEGGIHSRGRHVRPKGFREDAAKYRRAAILGWLVLRVTAADIRDGSAIADLEKAIQFRKGVVSLRADGVR